MAVAEANKDKTAFRKALGKNIKKYRKDRDLTLRDLAKKIDYTPGYIGLIEQGKSTPNTYILAQLAKALEVPISTLYGEEKMVNSVEKNDPILSKEENQEYIKIIKKAITQDVPPELIRKTLKFIKETHQ